MKYCANLLRMTGESLFADCMEQSFYNAYLGSLNTERRECPYIREKFIEKMKYPRVENVFLPVDSYSPLLCGKRGQKVGGTQIFSSLRYYGCCTAIAAAGVGVYLSHAVMQDEEGFVINFYESGEIEAAWEGVPVKISIKTNYPAKGDVDVVVRSAEKVKFCIKLRVPAWSKFTTVRTTRQNKFKDHYACVTGKWQGENSIHLSLDMRIQKTLPQTWESDVIYTDMSNMKPGSHVATATEVKHQAGEDHFVSFSFGPLTLCADEKRGKRPDSVFDILEEDGKIAAVQREDVTNCLVAFEVRSKNQETFILTDYASAGRDWSSDIAVWLPTK